MYVGKEDNEKEIQILDKEKHYNKNINNTPSNTKLFMLYTNVVISQTNTHTHTSTYHINYIQKLININLNQIFHFNIIIRIKLSFESDTFEIQKSN